MFVSNAGILANNLRSKNLAVASYLMHVEKANIKARIELLKHRIEISKEQIKELKEQLKGCP